MAKTIGLCKVHSFTISYNLCQCTTVRNTDAPNYAVVICIGLHHQFDRGCHVV